METTMSPARIDRGSTATTTIYSEGSDLVLRVHDNGADTGAPLSRAGAGAALANLRARLARLHGAAASLELTTPPEGGTDATLRLPYREAPGAR